MLLVQSPPANGTPPRKVEGEAAPSRPEASRELKSSRTATVPVTCVCPSFTERKAEEATATGPR